MKSLGASTRLYQWALLSYVLLLAGTLLYPDTFSSAGVEIGPLRLSPISLLFAAAAPGILALAWGNRSSFSFRAFDGFLLLTTAFVLVRGIVATGEPNELGLVAAYAAYVVLLYFGGAILFQRHDAIRIIMLSLAILGIIVSAYALVEFGFNRNVIFGDLIAEKVPVKSAEFHRTGSTLGQPIALGIFMVQTLPIMVFFFNRTGSRARQVFWGTAILLAVLALFTSYAKGSWLTLLALLAGGGLWIIWKGSKHQRSLILLVVVAGLAISVFASLFSESLSFNVFSSERRTESFNARIFFWQNSPTVIRDNILVGTGLHQGADAFFNRLDSEQQELMGGPLALGNLYITFLLEQGILGTGLAVATLLLFSRELVRVLRRPSLRVWALPLSISMAVVFINGATSESLMIWTCMVVFWLQAGAIRALIEQEKRNNMIGAAGTANA